MRNGMGCNQPCIQVAIKNALTTPSFDLYIAGYWKKVKKKRYSIAIASWIIRNSNGEVAKKVQRVEALDTYHTEMKTVLLAIQHAVALNIRGATVYTSSTRVVEAIRSFPMCKFELITVCDDLKRVVDTMDGCVVKKCSNEQAKNARDLAVEYSRYC